MPDVYYNAATSKGIAAESTSGGVVMRSGVNSFRLQTARTAANGYHPIIATSYAMNLYKPYTNTSTPVHFNTSPDVDGDQTSDTVYVTANQPTWLWAGGVAAKYSDTPQSFTIIMTPENQSGAAEVDFVFSYAGSDGYYSFNPTAAQKANGYNAITRTGQYIQFAYHYQQVPSPPQNLRAYSSSGNYGGIDLYWDAPADWGDGTDLGYDLFMDGQLRVSLGNQNSYTDTGAGNNQGHTYTIYARNNVSNYFGTYSQASNNASAAGSGLPTPVYNLSAYQNGYNQGQIDLYWSNNGSGSGATYITYDIYTTNNYNSPIANTNNTSFSVTGLANWQSYEFFVVPRNQFGPGYGGNHSTATSPGVPTAVGNLNGTYDSSTSGGINLYWSQPGNTSGGITRYTVYNDGNQVAQVAGNVTNVYLTGYTPGTSYGFDVRPWNQWGDNNGQFGAYSGKVAVTARGNPTVPNSLTASSVAATIGSVQLNWAAPDNTGGTAMSFYNIYVDDNYKTSVSGSLTSVTLTGISSNYSHNFSVAGRNQWNTSNGSIGPRTSNVSTYVPGVPSAPQNMNATPSPTTAGLVSLTWNAPATIGGTAGVITHYTIYRTDSNGNSYPDSPHDTKNDTSPAATSYNWVTTPKTASNFYVVAWNDAADASTTPQRSSPQSNTSSVTSTGAAPAPTNLVVTPGTTSIGRLVLTWSAPSGTIVNYTVTRNDGVQKVLNSTKYVDDTVVPGTTYSYYVQATNTTSVIGDPSTTISGTANTTSTQPVANLTVVNQTNTDLSGQYTINSTPTGASFTYRQTTPALAQTTVPTGAGTLVDNTNVFLNGTYFGNVYNTTQVNIAKSGTPFSVTPVPNGTLTDNTNVALNGNQKVVTAINATNKAFSYAATYADTSQRSASGTVVDTTNEIFNNGGNPVVLSSVTDNSITYPLTAANVAETTATGTATDITNRDYFNGHYTVKALPSPTSLTYERIPSNLRVPLTNLVTNPRMEKSGTTFTLHTNRCTNPSFETNTTGWTPDANVTAVRSTAFGYSGTSSLLVTKTTLTDATSGVGFAMTGMTVGNSYTISAYFRSGNGDAKPYFSVSGRSSSNPITLTTTWQRTSYTFVASATSHTFYIQSGAATVATSNFYVDAVLIQDSPLVNAYFDGSTTNTADFSYAWTGTAHASTSTTTATTVNGTSVGTDGTGQTFWAKSYITTAWTDAGSAHSLALVNRGAHNDQWVNIQPMVSLTANKTYTFKATVRTTDSIVDPQQIRLQVQNSSGTTSYVYSNIVGTPGTYTISGTFNTTGLAAGDYVRLYNRVNQPGATMYWDNIMIVEGSNLDAPFFSGASTGTSTTTYAWTGTADASTSTRVSDLTGFSGAIGAPYGGVQRSDNPAAMDVFYRSGWLG